MRNGLSQVLHDRLGTFREMETGLVGGVGPPCSPMSNSNFQDFVQRLEMEAWKIPAFCAFLQHCKIISANLNAIKVTNRI